MSSTQEVGEIFGAGSGPAHAMLRSPTVLIAAIGLWGMNLYFFRLFNIEYVKILNYDLVKLEQEEEERIRNSFTNTGRKDSNTSITKESEKNTLSMNDDSIRSGQEENSNKKDEEDNCRNDDDCDSNSNNNNDSNLVNNNYDDDSDDNDFDIVKLSDYNNNVHNNNNNNVSYRRAENKDYSLSSSSATNGKVLLTTPSLGKKNSITCSNSSSLSMTKIPSMTASTTIAPKTSIHHGPPVRSLSTSDIPPLQASSYDHDDLIDVEVGESAIDIAIVEKASLVKQKRSLTVGTTSSSNTSNSTSKGLVPQNDSVTWFRLAALSMSLLFVLHGTYFVWIDVLHQETISAVFCFYTAVAVVFLVPLKATSWLRKAARLVINRILELITIRFWCCRINEHAVKRPAGPRAIPFIDVFFADAMCSLSKVFFDWGMLLHMAYYYPSPVPQSANNILIPSAFASVPYIIRARQCLIMYSITRLKNDPARNQHLWNALKYSTSLFPLILSAYMKTVGDQTEQQLEFVLILLLAINALYSLYWDIVMDWGMMKNPTAAVTSFSSSGAGILCSVVGPNNATPPNTSNAFKTVPTPPSSASVIAVEKHNNHGPNRPKSCWYVLLRQRLRFGVAMSLLILLADTVLRFSWMLRFFHHVFPSGDGFVLCTQFLEIFRRAIWNLLRVEWEHIKQTTQTPAVPTTSSLAPSSSSTTATTNISTSGSSTSTTSSSGKPYSNLISRYNHYNTSNAGSNNNNGIGIVNNAIELTPFSSTSNDPNINGKDDDEKAKLLVPRTTPIIHHGTKIKP